MRRARHSAGVSGAERARAAVSDLLTAKHSKSSEPGAALTCARKEYFGWDLFVLTRKSEAVCSYNGCTFQA